MIITLKGADFSENNIGTLTTWNITTSLGACATYSGVTSVDRDPVSPLNATVTISEGYELGSAGVTVTMGGVAVTDGITVDGNTITINIAAVTGNVMIKVPTKNTATGEEEEPETPGGGEVVDPNLPTTTTWYVKAAHTGLTNELNSTNSSNGWVYSDTTEQAAIRNKPINALQIATTSISGTVYVAIADSKGASSVHDLTKGTFTKTGTTKEVVTVLLEKTLTLTDNQYLVFEPAGVAPTRNYTMYFGTPSGSKAGFISRVPIDTSGTSTAWKENATNTIGFSTGYYVEGAPEDTPETSSAVWYVDKASTSYTSEVKTDNQTYGWAYGGTSEQAAIRNKPINAVKFATTSTSGTVTIGVAKELKTGATITNVQSATFTKNGTAKELVTVVFDNTFTLADDEYLIFEPSNEINGLNYNHYYTTTNGAGFYSRIPEDISGQNKQVALFSTYDIGYATGYVPQ